MLKAILKGVICIIAFFFKSIAALISFGIGLIADFIFNLKDKKLLSDKEYSKAKNRRLESRVNKLLA